MFVRREQLPYNLPVIFPLGEPASTHEPVILCFLLILIIPFLLVRFPQEAVLARRPPLRVVVRVEFIRMMTHASDVRRRLPTLPRVVPRVAGRRAGTAASVQSRHRQRLSSAIPWRFFVFVAGSGMSTMCTAAAAVAEGWQVVIVGRDTAASPDGARRRLLASPSLGRLSWMTLDLNLRS